MVCARHSDSALVPAPRPASSHSRSVSLPSSSHFFSLAHTHTRQRRLCSALNAHAPLNADRMFRCAPQHTAQHDAGQTE
eukprot:232230-Rhodomonas_salina.1